MKLRYVTHKSPWKGSPKHEDLTADLMTLGKTYDVTSIYFTRGDLEARVEADKCGQCEVVNDKGERMRILLGHFEWA